MSPGVKYLHGRTCGLYLQVLEQHRSVIAAAQGQVEGLHQGQKHFSLEETGCCCFYQLCLCFLSENKSFSLSVDDEEKRTLSDQPLMSS